jgi:licheninase
MLHRTPAGILLLALFVFGCNSTPGSSPTDDSASPTQPEAPFPPPSSWSLVWADEFDGTGLPDTDRWTYDVGGHGWGNNELQYYTERRPENARVEDGHLVITARQEGWEGNAYTSARLVSEADWTYGRFEARAQLPSGRGTWPAVWMLPTYDTYGADYWPDNGEIDIMEHVGYAPDTVHATVHTEAYNHMRGTQRGEAIHVPDARSAFNVYAVEWTPDSIRGFVNDRPYFTFPNERRTDSDADWREWPFDRPFHFILNIAVGGSWGGAEGIDPSIWPQELRIDYVRVYRPAE